MYKVKAAGWPRSLLKLSMLFVLSAFLSAGSGCSSETRKYPEYLYVRLKKNPSMLDPALIVDLDSARIAAKLYNGLISFDEDLSPIPDIARSWSVSPDGRTYYFKLKKNVRFCNGREVTASDFKYSFERVLDPHTNSPRTWVLSRIKGAGEFMVAEADHVAGIRVVNPLELEIILDDPFAPFLSMLGLTTASVVAREQVDRYGLDFAFNPCGTGPFVLKKWQHNQFVVLERNSNYFNVPPKLQGIYYKILPENFTALVEFEKGGIDILPEIMRSEYGRYSGNPKWQPFIKTAPSLNTYYLGLNCQQYPFSDKRVRKALNYAIDRKKILDKILNGRGIPARGPVPPVLRSYSLSNTYPYDPGQAKRLLEEAGLKKGFSMTLYQTSDLENIDICQAIQAYLKVIGVDVRIVQLEWSSFLDVVAKGQAQTFWLSWWADYPDVENFLFPLFHSSNWGAGGNRCRYKSRKADTLIEEAVKTIDSKERDALYEEIEKLIIDDAPWVFSWHKSSCSVHQSWVNGYSVAPLAVMEKWNRVSLSR